MTDCTRNSAPHAPLDSQPLKEQLEKIRRMFAFQRAVNHAIVHTRSLPELFNHACQIAVEQGGFRMAWIGLRDPESNSVRPAAWAGAAGDYLDHANIVVDDTPRGQGPVGRALAIGRHFLSNDIAADPAMAPWRERALQAGFHSLASFPLMAAGKVEGSINLYSSIPGYFSEEEMALLDELAGDFSYAVEHIRQEEERDLAQESLRESEARFRAIFDHSRDAIGVSKKGIIEYANPAYIEMFGVASAGEVTGRPLLNQIAPECHAEMQEKVSRRARGEEVPSSYETTGIRTDGSRFAMDLLVSQFPMNGEVYTLGILRDISERKQVESQLRQQKEILQKIFDNIPLMINLISENGEISLVNREWEQVMGWTLDEIRLNTMDVFGEMYPDAGEYQRLITSLRNTGKHWVEFKTRVRSGQVIDTQWMEIRLSDGSNIGIGQEITEHKRIESDLRSSEERFRLLAENARDLIYRYELTPKRGFTYVSPSATAMTGYTPEEHYNDPDLGVKLVKEEDRALLLKATDSSSQPGSPLVMRWVRKDGQEIWTEQRNTPIFNAAGELIAIEGIARDITARKYIEQELEDERNRLAQRVEDRTAELTHANATLAQAIRVKDEFLSTMSHELRTPLNAILTLTESLEEGVYGALTEPQMKKLRVIAESGGHLLALINDILDLSKIEAGKTSLETEIVDVDTVCQGALRLVSQQALARRIHMRYQSAVQGLTISADPRRLKQMLVNLLSNAVKFTPEGGSLGLEVSKDAGGTIQFCVWDTGIGIAPQDMEKLFKPFTQIDSTLSRRYPGTGLGLALVQQLAQMHGGRVSVESQPGQGSRFTITLPG